LKPFMAAAVNVASLEIQRDFGVDAIVLTWVHTSSLLEMITLLLHEDARLAAIAPWGGSEGDYTHPGEEFGLVLKGTMELTVDGTTYLLREGGLFLFSFNQEPSVPV